MAGMGMFDLRREEFYSGDCGNLVLALVVPTILSLIVW